MYDVSIVEVCFPMYINTRLHPLNGVLYILIVDRVTLNNRNNKKADELNPIKPFFNARKMNAAFKMSIFVTIGLLSESIAREY